MTTDNNIVHQQIQKTRELLQSVLGENLLGVYIYGSLLMGGLQKYSDIDMFAVTSRETTRKEKERLVNALLEISGIYKVSKDLKPIELIVAVKSQVNPWQYPPQFDFIYGDWMRKDFEVGIIEPWITKESPNLALVITQLLLSHQILYGPNPNELLDLVPYRDFMLATTSEIDKLLNDIDWDTRNVLLTLARIWSTVETNTICSKAEAASWCINRLPNEHKPVLVKARLIFLGEQEDNWEDKKTVAKSCAEYIFKQIINSMRMTDIKDHADKEISLK